MVPVRVRYCGTAGPRRAPRGETRITVARFAVFPGVADHVVEAPGIRQLAGHRAGARAVGVAAVPEVAVVHRVAPIELRRRAGPAGVEPFGLGRQVHPRPLGVAAGIGVAEVHDGMVHLLRKTGTLPGEPIARPSRRP